MTQGLRLHKAPGQKTLGSRLAVRALILRKGRLLIVNAWPGTAHVRGKADDH